jgi:hypothetical protein
MYRSRNFLLGAVLVLLPIASIAGHLAPAIAVSLFTNVADTMQPAGADQHTLDPAVDIAGATDMPSALSRRVGEEIDRDEKEYFGLFSDIRNFADATMFQRSTGDVAFVITRSDAGIANDTTIIVSTETAEQLAIFVDHYEPICARKRYFDYRSCKDLIGLPAVSCTTTRLARVSLRNGAEYTAQILHAQDSALILWNGADVYDWQSVEENVISLPYHMIQAVTFKENTMIKRGLACGLGGCLIGGAAGALMGFASGGHELPFLFGPLVITAEDMALLYGIDCAALGGVAGGTAGIITGAGEGHTLRGAFQTYQSYRPSLNKNAVFPAQIPPELKRYSEGPDSHSEQ